MLTPVVVVHGGAGILTRDGDAGLRADQLAGLHASLVAAMRILEQADQQEREGTHAAVHQTAAEAAVYAAVMLLEDSPGFNAGRGAVFTRSGDIEHDAAIAAGDGRFGGVAGLRGIRNPISAARSVMDDGMHALLCGQAATSFALEQGCTPARHDYFFTERRYRQLKESEAGSPSLDHSGSMGTVGAVALDADGALAAATSTGGMTGKRNGRAGDSPIPGAGTWASGGECAVSCTGHGEAFLRGVTAYDVVARLRYNGQSLHEACHATLATLPPGSGGLIAVDRHGTVAMPYTTSGMLRGVMFAGGAPEVGVFEELEQKND